MSNRELLKRVIDGGDVRQCVTRFYSVCNGERKLLIERKASTDLDIEVYCTDLKQLELQGRWQR